MACKDHSEYYVGLGDSEVEAGAIDRIPYDKPEKEWQECFKKELRQAIDKLRDGLPPSGIVHATYWTKVEGGPPYDLENVLFYNLGIESWQGGMRFERGTGNFPEAKCAALPDGRTASHYDHRYRYVKHVRPDAAEGNQFTCWSLKEPLVRIEEVRFAENAGPCMQDCACVWYKCKMALAQRGPESPPSKRPDTFAVLLEVTRPARLRAQEVSPKGLFDGVISCLHRCTPQGDERVLARLVARLERVGMDVCEIDVRGLLRSGAGAILEERRFADLWKDTLKFAPQDERCCAGQMRLLEDKDEGAVWRLSATVYDVQKKGL
ncbi:MAG: hypothetical protein R6X20_10445 [Phycisphaerae bacterium]